MSWVLFTSIRTSVYAKSRDVIRVKSSCVKNDTTIMGFTPITSDISYAPVRRIIFNMHVDVGKYLKVKATDKVSIYYDEKNPFLWKIKKTVGAGGYKLSQSGTSGLKITINSSAECFKSFDSFKKFTVVNHEKKGNSIIINLGGDL